MSIFGDLEHHAFTDLIRVTRSQTGTLYLQRSYGGRSVDLHLHQGVLRCLHVDGAPVSDAAQAGDVIHHLVTRGQGPFEFQARDLGDVPSPFRLQLDDLIHQITSGWLIPETHLPHAETRFTRGASHREPSPRLAAAWTLVQPYLAGGVSARGLTPLLGMSERDVREMLHRLRAADLIAPLRAAPTGEQPSAPAGVQPASPVRRFLNALQRLTGRATP